MNKLKITSLIIMMGNILFAQNFSINGTYPFQEDSLIDFVTFRDDWMEIEFKNPTSDISHNRIHYEFIHKDGMPFVQLDEKLPPQIADWKEFKINQNIQTDNKILCLLGLRINRFNNKKYNCMFAYTKGYPIDKRTCTATRFDNLESRFYDCSSFLRERNREYPVENLKNLCPDMPWVEGVYGNGVGEGFSIKRNKESFLLIINGYISYEKPYLYEQNGRVEKLKVKGLKTGKEIIVDVLDTPHPQTVDISEINEAEDIRVTIEKVYPGTKYEDTCIHYLLLWDEQVIPYENSYCESKNFTE